ncbi:hypothetical protein OG21DRAFT_1440436, partial [Imleria badia]
MYGVVFLKGSMLRGPVSKLEVCFTSFHMHKLGPTLSHLLGMHRSSKGCSNLLEATTAVLDGKALQMLLISSQEVNMALCVRSAVQELIRDIDKVHNQAVPVASMSKLELQKLAWWF